MLRFFYSLTLIRNWNKIYNFPTIFYERNILANTKFILFQWWRWRAYGIVSGIPFPGPRVTRFPADSSVDASIPRRRLPGSFRRRRLQLHAVEQPRQKLHANGRLPERAAADLTIKKLNLGRADFAGPRRTYNRNIQRSRGKQKREITHDLRTYLTSLSYGDPSMVSRMIDEWEKICFFFSLSLLYKSFHRSESLHRGSRAIRVETNTKIMCSTVSMGRKNILVRKWWRKTRSFYEDDDFTRVIIVCTCAWSTRYGPKTIVIVTTQQHPLYLLVLYNYCDLGAIFA